MASKKINIVAGLPPVAKKGQLVTLDFEMFDMTKLHRPTGSFALMEGTTEGMPKFDGSLVREETLKYNITFEMRGQKMNMTVSRTIKKAMHNGQSVWRLVDETKGVHGCRHRHA